MSEAIRLHFDISGKDFTTAGDASAATKKALKQLGFPPDMVRRVAVAMYEAEINMVIHAGGGAADVDIAPERVKIVLKDEGPGIPDVEKAMQEGWSTASPEVREMGFGAGMGLPNIKKYSDDLQIKTKVGEGTTIQIIVYAS
jgi:anti-sigma regulatory factor (Ser/Thr protein kinase)